MAVGKPQSPPEPFESPATEMLDSWKEIARLSKRDEVRCGEWEKEGLPVIAIPQREGHRSTRISPKLTFGGMMARTAGVIETEPRPTLESRVVGAAR